jgi:ABC-2 type transport system permease protein
MTDDRGPRVAPVRLAALHMRMGALHELQYRANFWVQLGNSVVVLATGIIAISLVFYQTNTLGGWTRPELLALMGIHIMIGGVIRTLIQPNVTRLLEEVQEGKLDYALIRPIDSQLLVSVREISLWSAIDVALGLGVVVWATLSMSETVGAAQVAAFLVTAACGMVIMYCIWMAMATITFKLVDIYRSVQVLGGIYDAARWPVSIYPGWLRGTLTFVIPLAFAVTVPAEAVADRLDWSTLAWALVVTGVAAILTRRLWLWGVKGYSGASA